MSYFELKNKLAETLGFKVEKFHLDFPVHADFGDLYSNSALSIAKSEGRDPMLVAEDLKNKIMSISLPEIDRVEVVAPGFVNITLSKDFFVGNIREIISNDYYGRSGILKDKKIIIEYTDPNPFKSFHIGHLMTNTIGESLSRLYESQGANVVRACYQGDVGLHVAMAIYGIIKMDVEDEFFGAPVLGQVEIMGRAYAFGAKANREDEEAKKEIALINTQIYERSDEKVSEIYDEGRQASLQYFENIYQVLGTKFDFYFFESETAIFGKKVVEEFLDKGVFIKSEGAVIYEGEKHSLHNRVFINSLGLPTYEAKELGLAKMKYNSYPYDVSIVVTANEVKEYFNVVKRAMLDVYPELAQKTIHIPHGMMMLPSGKMSSRTGDVVTFDEIFESIKSSVKEKMSDREFTDKEKTIEDIAIGAIKYSILKSSPGKDIIFDINKSMSLDGDSGPYLQYASVRAKSVLNKAGVDESGVHFKSDGIVSVPQVARVLFRFEKELEEATLSNSPQKIVTYLLGVSSLFNNFYAQNKIIGGEQEDFHLAVALSVSRVIKNGLMVLGINTPDRM